MGRQLPTNESFLRKVRFDLMNLQQVTDLLQMLAGHGLYNEIQLAGDKKISRGDRGDRGECHQRRGFPWTGNIVVARKPYCTEADFWLFAQWQCLST